MKRILSIIAVIGVLFTSGCEKASQLMTPVTSNEPEIVVTQEPTHVPSIEPEVSGEEEEPLTKIPLTKTLEMTNDWTILGDYNYELTKKGRKDRIVLGTSAEAENGEMMWDDSQYWTIAVIIDDDGDGMVDGAYNLFSERIQGNVYVEVNEAYIKGVITPMVTAYIFSGVDRQIRNYTFDGECFVESVEYTTKNFSTGGINNMYKTIPEYKPL